MKEEHLGVRHWEMEMLWNWVLHIEGGRALKIPLARMYYDENQEEVMVAVENSEL